MKKRPLHDILCDIIGAPFPDGENHCYFSPPANVAMKYPCIKYNHANNKDIFADNIIYVSSKRYTVTIIDENPDTKIPDLMKKIPYCSLDRSFVVDGLNHFVYTLYYSGPRIKEENDE